MEEGFAESTIDATIHVICHQPADLKEWLDRHPPGDVLDRVARSRMAKNKAVPKQLTHKGRRDTVLTMALGFSPQAIPWSMGLCPRCRQRGADPVLLGTAEEGHICGECWRDERLDQDRADAHRDFQNNEG